MLHNQVVYSFLNQYFIFTFFTESYSASAMEFNKEAFIVRLSSS